MKSIHSPEKLYSELNNLNQINSVSQFYVPGKGQFTLVFQGYTTAIKGDIDSDEESRRMAHESWEDYEEDFLNPDYQYLIGDDDE